MSGRYCALLVKLALRVSSKSFEHLTYSVHRWVGGIRSLSAQGLEDWVVHVTAIHQLLPKEAQQAISMHSCVAEANSTGAGQLERNQIEHT